MSRYSHTPIKQVQQPYSGVDVFRTTLRCYSSEEGMQTEFQVECLSRETVEQIAELWLTNPKLVRSIVMDVTLYDPEEQ